MSGVKAEQVIEAYTKLRDKRAELKKEYEAADAALKDKIAKLDAWLLETMQSVGTDQLKGNGSIAFKSVVTKAGCEDWGEFWNFCANAHRLDMLEKRVSVKSVTEYLKEHGSLPPGISVRQEVTVNVRKA